MNERLAALDRTARKLGPAAGLLLLVLLEHVWVAIPGFQAITPSLTTAAVFFWTLYRPSVLPLGFIFLAGLLSDLLGSAPLGLEALTLSLLALATASQRAALAPKPFTIVWGAFVLFALGALAVRYLLVTLLSLRLGPLTEPFLSLALTIGLFPPLVAGMLLPAERLLGKPG